MINRLAIIVLAGFVIGASGVEVSAYDWPAAKNKALADLDVYAKTIRPLSMSEPRFKFEQAVLISEIGLPPDEIDPEARA
ncbi:MAG: hypothetical protein A2X40_02160 [Elusimicrobia bacterium GWC2_65_9]|nr:MAG: hypothetical protein A2X40_02160 [Elusimicrobia bacterium GWC2_65_9]OHC66084.1 MAG: hypothetical protein A2040_03850 [Rhodocyclales bacterium GWA2_65_19]